MGDSATDIIRLGDAITLVVYLVATLGLGLWFGIRTKTTEGYFLGGRKMPGWAVGISMLGTAISSITFLAYPGSAYDGNFSRIVPGLALPIGAIVAIFIFVPFYRKTGFISAYTYFERRYGLWGRVYACGLFSLASAWRMGMILYLLSMAVTSIHTGWSLPVVIIVIGIFVTVYTVLGGIEAVIWTDVFQTIVLVLGGLSVILVVFLTVDGGAITVFSMGMEANKFSFVGQNVDSMFDFSFARDTLIMLLMIGAIGNIQEFATDQTKMQRYCAASTLAGARRATWVGGLGCIPVWLVFMFAGTCLWVFYQMHPERMATELLADEVFPYFILRELPTGLGGVVIAGVLAAAMSSIDSSMSGATTVLTEDIYKRVLVRGKLDSHYLIAAKTIAALSGVIMIVLALSLTLLRQEAILDIAFIIGAMLGGGLGGFFFMGFFTTRANSFGGACGVILAVLATIWMTNIEAKAKIWESRETFYIEAAKESGTVDAEALRQAIVAEATAQGIKLKKADVDGRERQQLREMLKSDIHAELGERPPHLGEAIGIHSFMMGVIGNFLAILAGYLLSLFRPAKTREELGGLTWWTRHMERIDG